MNADKKQSVFIRVLLWLIFVLLPLPIFAQSDLTRYVNPFVGTGGEGHTFPGAVVPFGMVQLSPDTQLKQRKEGYDWAAGYRYDDSTIFGFSHTHFSGTGHSDLGDILVMPIAGEVKLEPG